jgi:hypothetical protein
MTELGITGGEPTLMAEQDFELFGFIKDHLPSPEIRCLTNRKELRLASDGEKTRVIGT